MHPITDKATEVRVMRHFGQELAVLLARLDQGLLLCGVNPEESRVRRNVVETIRMSHGRVGVLIGEEAMVKSEMYDDSRGLTP